jgi:hypothetical protein
MCGGFQMYTAEAAAVGRNTADRLFSTGNSDEYLIATGFGKVSTMRDGRCTRTAFLLGA